MRTDRRLWKLILLSIVTFGIYPLFFWSRYARDMNTVCEGDGKKTRGILFRILISPLTFGIYEYIWMYAAGDRIYVNMNKRGRPTTCSGNKVLLWYIFGVLIIVGPFIAMHQLIEGLNDLCLAYNEINGLNSGEASARPVPAAARMSGSDYNPSAAGNEIPVGDVQQPVTSAAYAAPSRNPGMAVPGGEAAYTSRQAQPTPAGDAGANEVNKMVNNAVSNVGKAAHKAGDFLRSTLQNLNQDTQQGGMKWMWLLPAASVVCLLFSFLFDLGAAPSLFAVFAACGLVLLWLIPASSAKAYSAIPFSVIALDLIQNTFWRLPALAYLNFMGWLFIFVSLLIAGGCVVEWLLLYGNPSFRKQGVMIVLGAHALMAVYFLVRLLVNLFSAHIYSFPKNIGIVGYVLFAAGYLLLFYRDRFSMLTALTHTEKSGVLPQNTQEQTLPEAEETRPFIPADQWVPDPMYEKELGVPKIQLEKPFVPEKAPEIPAFRAEPPRMPAAEPEEIPTITCPSCGKACPAGTALCPNCGATLHQRRRRSSQYN